VVVDALKFTVNGAAPNVGVAVNRATGGLFVGK
jgi:hypothetical protein